jgi:hypothetical protein
MKIVNNANEEISEKKMPRENFFYFKDPKMQMNSTIILIKN